MKQFTEKQAIQFAESGEWKNWTDEEIVMFQLYQKRLCMDFSVYHKALGKVLGRPVFIHELADPESLRMEYESKKSAPTFDEILSKISTKEIILIDLGDEDGLS